ncbi:MAG: hypothetical protein K2Q01_00540 [Rickettsiales bacterium]|nr:hypothetical protein [Rickettsiales bacterium]
MSDLCSLDFMAAARSAYNSAAVRLSNPDTAQAATRFLQQYPNLEQARQAIAEDVSPAR